MGSHFDSSSIVLGSGVKFRLRTWIAFAVLMSATLASPSFFHQNPKLVEGRNKIGMKLHWPGDVPADGYIALGQNGLVKVDRRT